MSENSDRLKREANMLTVLEYLGINTVKKGDAYFFKCPNPNHVDKHPSCYTKNGWTNILCNSCGYNVTAIDLIMQELNMDFKSACDYLAEIEGNPEWYSPKGKKKKKDFFSSEEKKLIGISYSDIKNFSEIQILDFSYEKCNQLLPVFVQIMDNENLIKTRDLRKKIKRRKKKLENERLIKNNEKLLKNEEALKFSCRVQVYENNMIKIVFNGLNPEYEVAVNKLCNQIVSDGLRKITEIYKTEMDRINMIQLSNYKAEIKSKIDFFLNLLLNRKYNVFEKYVRESAQMFCVKTYLQNIKIRKGKWMVGEEEVPDDKIQKICHFFE